jgi:serine/threonine protein kinase
MELFDRLRSLLFQGSAGVENQPLTTQPRATDGAVKPVHESPAPLVGTLVKDRYLVERELGRGGIGVVYRAVDRDVHERPVVIKVLLDCSAASDWLVKKFHHESEALARIDDPGVVKVLDCGRTDDGAPFFVMEFIRGPMLRSRMSPKGMELREVALLVQQIGQALSAAHDEKVVHRDLKPENVMLHPLGGGGEYAKLIDFGIAQVKDPRSASGTVGYVSAGTLPYMAPEQIEHGTASSASDVYALGVMAYEMLTGVLPFVSDADGHYAKAVDLLGLQRAGRVRSPSGLRTEIPAKAATLVLQALSYDPSTRPPSARAFGNMVALALTAGDGAYEQVDVPTEIREPVGEGTRQPISRSLRTPRTAATFSRLDPGGGAVTLDSEFYVVRDTDPEFNDAVARGDSIVLLKGARQMGKTSLLARGVQRAREGGARVVVTDLQAFDEEVFATSESFYLALAEGLTDQLGLDVAPKDVWSRNKGASVNFRNFVKREVLDRIDTQLVWALDEADRLFVYPYRGDVFGLFRSWHNARAFEPDAPWRRLTLAIAYATEAHLFIRDENQSPFNVGTRLALSDFTTEQNADLNRHYGSPLGDADLERFGRLVGGHPYLVRRGLYHMAVHEVGLDALESVSPSSDGPFGDHLRHMEDSLSRDPELVAAMRAVLRGEGSPCSESFYLLRSIGAVTGETAEEARPRCGLYAAYFERHLAR